MYKTLSVSISRKILSLCRSLIPMKYDIANYVEICGNCQCFAHDSLIPEYNTILCVQTVKWESHSSHNLLLEITVLLSQVEGARFISLCRIENSRVRSVGWKFYPRRSIYLEGKLLLPQNERSSAPALEGNTCFSRYFYHGHASFPPSPLHVHDMSMVTISKAKY